MKLDRRRFEKRRVRWFLKDGTPAPRPVQMAELAEVRVFRFPDGWWLFSSDSKRVDFLTNDPENVDINKLWPQDKAMNKALLSQ